MVRQVVERVRKYLPRLDGETVLLCAWMLSTMACWILGVRGASAFVPELAETLPRWLDYLVTGGIITFGASFFNDLITGRSQSQA